MFLLLCFHSVLAYTCALYARRSSPHSEFNAVCESLSRFSAARVIHTKTFLPLLPAILDSPYSSLSNSPTPSRDRLCKNMYFDFVKILPHLLFFMIFIYFCSVINTKKVESSFAGLFFICMYSLLGSERIQMWVEIFNIFWYIQGIVLKNIIKKILGGAGGNFLQFLYIFMTSQCLWELRKCWEIFSVRCGNNFLVLRLFKNW